MKRFLVLIFSLMAVTFISATVINENVSIRPLTTVQTQRFKSKELFLTPREMQNKKIQRIIRLMHLMELACLKKYAKPINYRNRFGYERPFKRVKPFRMPAIRSDVSNLDDQIPFFYPGQQTQPPSPERKYFGNSRVIFVPPLKVKPHFTHNINGSKTKETLHNIGKAFPDQIPKEKNVSNEKVISLNKKITKTVEKGANFTQRGRNSQSDPRKSPSGRTQQEKKGPKEPGFNEKRIQYIKLLPPDYSKSEEEIFTIENLKNLDEIPDVMKPAAVESEKSIKFPQIKSTTANNLESVPRHFFNRSKPNQVEQYEVEEIIEEKVRIDIKNNKNNHVQNVFFDEKNTEEEIALQNNETDINDFISKSINSVLKSLINPMEELPIATEKTQQTHAKKKFDEWHSRNTSITPFSPRILKTFSNQRPENFLKKINEKDTPPPFNGKKPTKTLNLTTGDQIFNSWRDKTTEITPEMQNDVKPVTTEYKALTMENHIKQSTQATLDSDAEQTGFSENSREKTSPPPAIETSSVSFTEKTIPSTVYSTEKFDLVTDRPNNRDSSVFSVPQTTQSSFLKSTLTAKTEDSTSSVTPEISTTESQNLDVEGTETTKNIFEIFTDKISTAQTEQTTLKSVKNFSDEMEQTVFDYQELTSQSMTFDLFTTENSYLRKDKEAAGRKMHFNQNLKENTTFTESSNVENEEQRRSDILINETISDYDDLDNNFTIYNYLDKIRQSNSFSPADTLLNLTTDSIIPLIPVVITDLREGKILAEDLPILSKIFGKYWTAVMSLTNTTNLDMLPLLKMKNEDDFKNVLENSHYKNLEVTTTASDSITTAPAETRKDTNYETYDYLEEYKDLYEDVLESETEKNEKKQKKYRYKRNEEDSMKKLKNLKLFIHTKTDASEPRPRD